jgi:hypothetical protein
MKTYTITIKIFGVTVLTVEIKVDDGAGLDFDDTEFDELED